MTKKAEEKKDFDQVYAEAELKRKELEAKHKCKVKAAIFRASVEDEPCVVYFKAATTFTKMQCMDLAIQSPMKASAAMFDATVIKEESDARVFQRDNDEDTYYLSAIHYCGELVVIARNTLKKK